MGNVPTEANMTQSQKKIKKLFLKSASKSTAYDPNTYNGDLSGHCFAVAYTIKQLAGGEIVCGKVNGERHAWNLLPNGDEVDYTSCQFGGDGITPLTKYTKIHNPKTINPRFVKFYEIVLENLKQQF